MRFLRFGEQGHERPAVQDDDMVPADEVDRSGSGYPGPPDALTTLSGVWRMRYSRGLSW